jgi:hypothetical protein
MMRIARQVYAGKHDDVEGLVFVDSSSPARTRPSSMMLFPVPLTMR